MLPTRHRRQWWLAGSVSTISMKTTTRSSCSLSGSWRAARASSSITRSPHGSPPGAGPTPTETVRQWVAELDSAAGVRLADVLCDKHDLDETCLIYHDDDSTVTFGELKACGRLSFLCTLYNALPGCNNDNTSQIHG